MKERVGKRERKDTDMIDGDRWVHRDWVEKRGTCGISWEVTPIKCAVR